SLVKLLAATDVGLLMVFLGDQLTGRMLGKPSLCALLGSPWGYLSVLTNLGGELTIPAWYSSMKLALLALLILVLACPLSAAACFRERIALGLLPTIFFALSFDEIASIHEALGEWFRAGSAARLAPWIRTWNGVWVILLSPALVVGFLILL